MYLFQVNNIFNNLPTVEDYLETLIPLYFVASRHRDRVNFGTCTKARDQVRTLQEEVRDISGCNINSLLLGGGAFDF